MNEIKNIDLCGMGNGLVDIQFEVSDSELAEIGVPKGEMRLYDSEEQKKVLDSFAQKINIKCSGGSAANTIIAFSKFGGKSAYKTVLGDDDFGKFYADEFTSLGIELFTQFISEDNTGTCIVLISEDSERTMLTSLGASGHFSKDNISEDLIKRSEWLYIEGYKFSEQNSTEAVNLAIELAKKHNTKISFTFSDVFIIDQFRQNLEKVVRVADLIFCNEMEALCYTGKNNIEDAIEELSKYDANLAVTMGPNGAIIFWDNKTYMIPAYKTEAIDSTGAGDMFAAGFLYGIIKTGSPELAGNLGSLAASKVVSQFGARLNNDHIKIRDQILK